MQEKLFLIGEDQLPLDKVILDHVEEIQSIEDEIGETIDFMIDDINIDAVIDNPESALNEFTSHIIDLLDKEYFNKAMEKGIELAKEVKKDGDIQIVKSKNPTLNKGLVENGEITHSN